MDTIINSRITFGSIKSIYINALKIKNGVRAFWYIKNNVKFYKIHDKYWDRPICKIFYEK
jgi:hypothetical protein